MTEQEPLCEWFAGCRRTAEVIAVHPILGDVPTCRVCADRHELTTRRWVAYAQDGITDPDNPNLHMVAYVAENSPGYWPTTYTGSLDYCRSVAASINESGGHTERDVYDIIASSFAAVGESA
jgi:hypothetical protein